MLHSHSPISSLQLRSVLISSDRFGSAVIRLFGAASLLRWAGKIIWTLSALSDSSFLTGKPVLPSTPHYAAPSGRWKSCDAWKWATCGRGLSRWRSEDLSLPSPMTLDKLKDYHHTRPPFLQLSYTTSLIILVGVIIIIWVWPWTSWEDQQE